MDEGLFVRKRDRIRGLAGADRSSIQTDRSYISKYNPDGDEGQDE
jgi:hypothetical protein